MSAPVPVITDVRGLVARQPGARFARRPLSALLGVVFHQALGTGDVFAVARYHTSKESHLAPGKGAPSICYTYFVDTDGTIQWCNDLEDVTWSQGGGSCPIPGAKANTNFVAVVFRGDFTGPGHEGKSKPTPAQLESAAQLWRWLRDTFRLGRKNLFGHCDFGKPACPGEDLVALIERLRAEPDELAAVTPVTVENWQRALVILRYSIGLGGPRGDGVDGDWGPLSQAALVAFQSSKGIPRTGSRDDHTASVIASTLHGMGVTSLTVQRRKRAEKIEAPVEVVAKEE